MSILRLVASPGVIDAGEVVFDGQDLLRLDDAAIRRVRGDRIATHLPAAAVLAQPR
ncbi:MAG: hypothetical protein R3C32_08905 [Chloroflexota bacterium]